MKNEPLKKLIDIHTLYITLKSRSNYLQIKMVQKKLRIKTLQQNELH